VNLKMCFWVYYYSSAYT